MPADSPAVLLQAFPPLREILERVSQVDRFADARRQEPVTLSFAGGDGALERLIPGVVGQAETPRVAAQ
jgi:hypothetical protein